MAPTPGETGSSHPPQKAEGALKVELGEASQVCVLKALAPEDPGSPVLRDPGWSLHQRLQPLPSAPLRPPPEAALNRLGDPLGDWRAVSTADQEREAETWKGRERMGGGAGKAQAKEPEVKSENAEAPEGKGSLRYGGGTRQARDGRAGFEARSRQTHTE